MTLQLKPVLMVAEPMKPFVLQTDASSYGLGAILSQAGDDGCEHPVAYVREVNYAKECLAIDWSIKHFHFYLYGQAFTIETNHCSLSWLNRTKNANAGLTRWFLELQPYQFQLKYRKGPQTDHLEEEMVSFPVYYIIGVWGLAVLAHFGFRYWDGVPLQP